VDAVNAFTKRGGAPAAKRVVCGSQSTFGCYVSSGNIGKCRPLLNKAKGFGFTLPDSTDSLRGYCGGRLQLRGQIDENEVVEEQALVPAETQGQALASAGGCSSSIVDAIANYAPDCIAACPHAKCLLVDAVNAFTKRGGAPAAKRVVCGSQSTFGCYVSSGNIGKCRPLLNKAKGFGFTLPDSTDSLRGYCARRLLAAPTFCQ